MGTKLVKLDIPDQLHRRIKTLAASQDKRIQTYVLEVLEEHVPRQITFPESEVSQKKRPN
jgi:predicted HicB family RNase H-like nuclease